MNFQNDKFKKIKGVVENIVFTNKENGYAVLEIIDENDEIITAVGSLSELCAGEEIEFYGFFKAHVNYGEQFRVEAFEAKMPKSEQAVRKYLAAGSLPYIGAALANKIVDAFKEETLEIIATNAKKLSEIKGISLQKAIKIQEEFKRKYSVREVIAYLNSLDINSEDAISLFNTYGENTNEIVKNNPYVLCNYPVFLQFELADKIASDFSMEYNSSKRISAGILYILRHNLQNNGHTCLPSNKLINAACGFLSVEENEVYSAFLELQIANEIETITLNDVNYAFLKEYLIAETNISEHIKSLLKLPKIDISESEKLIQKLEIVANIKYAPLQRQAIINALTHKILVLTGGPGTGKTTTVNGIINAFDMSGERVALAAPTGRAAKRLSEITKRKATTIHRLLEVDYTKNNIVKFVHNEKNLLKLDVVVIDEMSMVDILLFDSLLCALKPSCKIVLIGDEDQLPSVGAGNVLGSLLNSQNVPYIRLNEVFRQAAQSDIVSNAHKIVKGEPLVLSGYNSDFFMMDRQSATQCASLVCELVSERLPKKYNYNMLEDIQVLCPTKIGPLGTVALNAALQDKINPFSSNKPQITLQDRVFRLGDKVMQIKNNYDLQYIKLDTKEEGAGVFNGDLGIITEIDLRLNSLTVLSADRSIIYPAEFLYELELAYAITIHKSQGSEFEAVIIPLFEVPKRLCYRNLLYTGVTRAKQICIICGQIEQSQNMIDNALINKRYSCLSALLLKD